MYFRESDDIVREHEDLQNIIDEIDRQLATIFSPAPLRATDIALAIGCDKNQVDSIFELLSGRGALKSEAMVECEQCHNLMPAAAFHQAIEDEDEFECSSCGRPFRSHTQPVVIYRMTPEFLSRPRPDVPGLDVSAALATLGHADQVFQCWGQKWIVKYQEEIKIMDDVRGMFYIARLLAEPNRDVPAVSLLAAAAGIDPRVATGTSGPLLTAETHAEYKKKYLEAQEELEDARTCNDLSRIESAQRDLGALGNEIARATGLGGRQRQQTDAQRVRKSVSMAVDRAIESIGKDTSLGRHLDKAIVRGLTFKYDPEQTDMVWLT